MGVASAKSLEENVPGVLRCHIIIPSNLVIYLPIPLHGILNDFLDFTLEKTPEKQTFWRNYQESEEVSHKSR